MNTIHIACACDARYVAYCGTMLRTLLRRLGRAATIHHLGPPEFTESDRSALAGLLGDHDATLRFHVVADHEVAGLPPMRDVPQLAWYRLFLPDLLPDLPRVLYLDSDILVLGSIEPLWNTDLGGHPFAAVRNAIEPNTRARLLPALGLAGDAAYFNSGVMMMDLDAMRRTRVRERVLEYARRYSDHLVWGDQDALNGVLSGDYQALHPRWNCMNSLFHFAYARQTFSQEVILEAVRDPVIVHFEGPNDVKPWDMRSSHPLRAAYLRELRATLWRMPRPLGARMVRDLWYRLPIPLRRGVQAIRRFAMQPTAAA